MNCAIYLELFGVLQTKEKKNRNGNLVHTIGWPTPLSVSANASADIWCVRFDDPRWSCPMDMRFLIWPKSMWL